MSYPAGRRPEEAPQPAFGGLARILHLSTLTLGVVILFLGFAPVGTGLGPSESFYSSGVFLTVPALFLLGGLLALPALLPGDGRAGVLPVAGTAPGALGVLFTSFSASWTLGIGFLLVLALGLVQLATAVAAYLVELGVIKTAPRPAALYGGGSTGGFGPPSPGFPQGGYPPPPYPYGHPGPPPQPYGPPPQPYGQPAPPYGPPGQPPPYGPPPQQPYGQPSHHPGGQYPQSGPPGQPPHQPTQQLETPPSTPPEGSSTPS